MVSTMGSVLVRWKDQGVDDQSLPVVVTSCGFQRFVTKDYAIHRPQGRVDYQLIYLLEGRGVFRFGPADAEVGVGEGRFVLFRPGEPQVYRYRHADRTALYWAHLTGSGVEASLQALGLGSGSSPAGVDVNVAELFDRMIRELQLKAGGFPQVAAGLVLQILGLLARCRTEAEGDRRPLPDDIGRAVDLMYRTSAEPYTAARFAEASHLSVYRFIHKFREVTGQAPLEYLTAIRMAAAKQLLVSSSYNVAEVAAVVGYENPLYFSRLFRKNAGLSPTAYRQSAS